METITNLLDAKGTPLDQQRFTWKDINSKPISKLDDDAFTRVRVILMNGVESDAIRLQSIGARFSKELREPLAHVRRVEQHQQTSINWMIGADHSPLETTIAYEQVAIEVTGAVAQNEPDPYQAQTYRFGLLEDFDHLYRYAAMLDRLEGKDANNILQGYTDIVPGRPTHDHHRDPSDDLREPYDSDKAELITKVHAALITAAEYQTHDYYMHVGPLYADPVARALYAEIASIEEQHVTQYTSLMDPNQSLLEQWLIHEVMEAYLYLSCAEQEDNPRIKAIWERYLDYELGHINLVSELIKKHERRDPAQLLSGSLPKLVDFKSHRDFMRKVVAEETDLRARNQDYVSKSEESKATRQYREHMNSQGVPADDASAGYIWQPGTELARKAS